MAQSPLTSPLSECDTQCLSPIGPSLEHDDLNKQLLRDNEETIVDAGTIRGNPRFIQASSRPLCTRLETLQLQYQIDRLEKDNQYYQKKHLEAEERANDLERLHFVKENTQGILAQQDSDFTRRMLNDYQMKIQNLKMQLQRHVNLDRIILSTRKQASVSDREKLTNHMSSMANELEHVMCYAINEMIDLNHVRSDVECPELHALTGRILRQGDSGRKLVSYHYAVRSLISAALCLWVFEIEWREQCLSNSLLMDTLVSHVVTHGMISPSIAKIEPILLIEIQMEQKLHKHSSLLQTRP